jgi:hypothetical protein
MYPSTPTLLYCGNQLKAPKFVRLLLDTMITLCFEHPHRCSVCGPALEILNEI